MTTVKVKNGNYYYKLYSDGTKIRQSRKRYDPLHPESIDLKITNYCENNCAYCHENSNVDGKYCEYSFLERIFDLPAGVEVAIGGGNPLQHPELLKILKMIKGRGCIPNITVNSRNMDDSAISKIDRYVGAFGVSYSGGYKELKNGVMHLILGIHGPSSILRYNPERVLLLGYKDVGRGKDFQHRVDLGGSVVQWNEYLKGKLKHIMAFDNLAIEQLGLGSHGNYMGDDGQFTFYIDAVKQQYSKSSCSLNRHEGNGMKITEMFKSLNGCDEV